MAVYRKILKYVSSLSPAAKASFWFVVSNVMLKGISFITTPIFTRLLNVADYGMTSVFVTWEGVISIFATLSLSGGVYNVAMTKFEDEIDGFTSIMIGLTALSSSAVYLICMGINFIAPSLFQLNQSYLIYMWIQTFANATASFWLMRKRFEYRYQSVILYTFCNAFLSPSLAIVMINVFSENKAYAKVIGAGLPGIVFGFYIGVRALLRGRKIYHRKYWLYALKFNIPLIPHYLSSILMNSSDRLMINYFCGAAQAGIYSIANSITGLISIITQAINQSLIPYTLQSIKKHSIHKLYQVVLGCTALVSVVCILVVLFAREGVMLFATEDYIDAVWFVAPLVFATQISFVSGLIGNIIFYYEKTQYMSMITIICATVNIITNIFGIQLFGYIAAGYTTLLSSFMKMMLYYLCAKKFEKDLHNIINLKWLFSIFVITIMFIVYGMVFNDNLMMKLWLVFLIFAVCFLLRKKITYMIKKVLNKEVD